MNARSATLRRASSSKRSNSLPVARLSGLTSTRSVSLKVWMPKWCRDCARTLRVNVPKWACTQADREGFPEVAEAYKRIAFEEAEHAAKFAELLGEVVYADTKKNLELRVAAEAGATEGKLALAKRAKELGYDAIHDTVHEMCKDEARHGSAFQGLLGRYFK